MSQSVSRIVMVGPTSVMKYGTRRRTVILPYAHLRRLQTRSEAWPKIRGEIASTSITVNLGAVTMERDG